MKSPWLILAATLALVATSAEARKKSKLTRLLDMTDRPGVYTAMGMPARDQEMIFNKTDVLPMQPLESSKPLEPRLDLRTKREAVALRRGRMRAGARPICRGCYSGLMIVGPPGQESENATWSESYSESEGWSSEGD